MLGNPDSTNVGTSGSVGCRLALEIASARTLPDRTNGMAAVTASDPTGGSPATTAAAAGPAPLKCTAGTSTLPSARNRFSAVRCGVVPLPGDA